MDFWVADKLKSSENMAVFDTKELTNEWAKIISGQSSFDFRCWRWLNLINWIKNNDK